MAGLVIAAALAATIAPGLGGVEWASIAQPWPLMLVLMGLLAATVGIVRRTGPPRAAEGAALRTVALALLVAAIANGAWVNARAEPMRHMGPEIAAVRDSLPEDAVLYSFRHLHVRFVYFWEDEIPILPWPNRKNPPPDDLEYFAVWLHQGMKYKLRFEWEEIATIRIDQQSQPEPRDWILIGRRVK
jgi:hypothetical protein